MASNRPLSPHLLIYKPQLTSVLSISHRLTGLALVLGSVLAVAWVVALASGPSAFAVVQTLANSIIGQVILFGFSLALFYHLLNGIRHLLWDFGYCLSLKGVYATGYAVVAATILLTGGLWLKILWCGG